MHIKKGKLTMIENNISQKHPALLSVKQTVDYWWWMNKFYFKNTNLVTILYQLRPKQQKKMLMIGFWGSKIHIVS